MSSSKMTRLTKLRAWINRDDGQMFQVGNRDLSAIETIGLLLLVSALIVKVLHDKAGFSATWIGWVCLVVGVVLVLFGVWKDEKRDGDT
jgi:hypothetical protein